MVEIRLDEEHVLKTCTTVINPLCEFESHFYLLKYGDVGESGLNRLPAKKVILEIGSKGSNPFITAHGRHTEGRSLHLQ